MNQKTEELEGEKSNNSESSIHARKSESSQTYVGIVIGVLSVTVVLLLTTIILILRKNRQKIFSKHSSELVLVNISDKIWAIVQIEDGMRRE